jgi:hypothetical protein
VYCFYLQDGPTKVLFEYLQADLETETEVLSGLLEHGCDDRKKIIDVSKVAKKRLINLMEGVKNGLGVVEPVEQKKESKAEEKVQSFAPRKGKRNK